MSLAPMSFHEWPRAPPHTQARPARSPAVSVLTESVDSSGQDVALSDTCPAPEPTSPQGWHRFSERRAG